MMPTTGWKQINKINKNLAHNTAYHCQDYTEMTSCICFSLLGFTPPTSEIKQRQKKKQQDCFSAAHKDSARNISATEAQAAQPCIVTSAAPAQLSINAF